MKIESHFNYYDTETHYTPGHENCHKAYCPIHRYLWRTCAGWDCPWCVRDGRVMMVEKIIQEAHQRTDEITLKEAI